MNEKEIEICKREWDSGWRRGVCLGTTLFGPIGIIIGYMIACSFITVEQPKCFGDYHGDIKEYRSITYAYTPTAITQIVRDNNHITIKIQNKKMFDEVIKDHYYSPDPK